MNPGIIERVDMERLKEVGVSDSLSGIKRAVGSGMRVPIVEERGKPVTEPVKDEDVVIEYGYYKGMREVTASDGRIPLHTCNIILGLLRTYSGRIHALMHSKWDNRGSVNFHDLHNVKKLSELPFGILEGIRRTVVLLENTIVEQARKVKPDYKEGHIFMRKDDFEVPDVRKLTACLLMGDKGKLLHAGVHCPGMGYDFTEKIKEFSQSIDAMLVLRGDMSFRGFLEYPELLQALSQIQRPMLKKTITLAAVSIDENRIPEGDGERIEGREKITVTNLNSLMRESIVKKSLRGLGRAGLVYGPA